MKLLIGTINALIVWDNGHQNTIAKGNYYGVTWNEERIYCSRNPKHNPISVIDVFDKSFQLLEPLFFSIQPNNVHQILIIDGRLHITNTQCDRIIEYNLCSGEMKSHNWTGEEGDRCHINSIWIEGDRIYVVESGLKGKKCPPAIQVLDKSYKSLIKHYVHTRHIHNVYMEGGEFYNCSHTGLMKGDQELDLRKDKENGFFRGLARSNTHWYIGESQVLPRPERSFGDASILVLDNDFNIADVIALKDTGQIQDIRIMDEPDLAHNGVSF